MNRPVSYNLDRLALRQVAEAILKTALGVYRHLELRVHLDPGTYEMVLTVQDPSGETHKLVTWNVMAFDWSSGCLVEILYRLKKDLERMFEIEDWNRRVGWAKMDAKEKEWINHFGILAELAEDLT
jgi:hypothetical protein